MTTRHRLRAERVCELGLGLGLGLGSPWRGGGTVPTPTAPTVLTAPTITLSGTTATITLGTFSGADSQTNELLLDGAYEAAAVAGDLDVTAYTTHNLRVRSTGTNASGSTESLSASVSIPLFATEMKFIFKDTNNNGPNGRIAINEAGIYDPSGAKVSGTWMVVTPGGTNDFTAAFNDGVTTVDPTSGTLAITGSALIGTYTTDTLNFTASSAFTPDKLKMAGPSTTAPGTFEIYYKDTGGSWVLLTTITKPSGGWAYLGGAIVTFPAAGIPPVPIPDTVLGVNYNYIEGYAGADVAKNLLETPGSVTGTGGEYLSSPISPITATPTTGTLPMDQNGAITDFPTVGGTKQSSIKFSVDSVRGGTFAVTAPSGMTASPTSVTIPAGGNGSEIAKITLSGLIPTGGIKVGGASANFTCLLSGDAHPEISTPPNALHDGYDMGNVVRWMTPLRTNDPRSRTLTAADAAYDGPASQGQRSFRAICEYHNAIYSTTGKVVSPWINILADSDTTYMAAVAQYMFDNLNPAIPVRVEYSNETWNTFFYQTKWLWKQGYNAGYSATAPTPQTATDFQGQSGNARYPAVTYASGDKVFAHTDGLDFIGVWVALQAVPIGSVGALPTTSAGNAYWSYETSNNDATGLAFAGRKYKGYKERQMIDAFTGVFTGADRSRLILVHADWALDTNTNIIENLTFFNNQQEWGERAIGCYWGASFPTGTSSDLNLYAYGSANTGQALTPTVQALYTAFNGGSTADQETLKAAWFSTAQAAVDAAMDYHAAQKQVVAQTLYASYDVPIDAIPHAVYEGNYDMGFSGYSDATAAKAMKIALLADSRMGDLVTYVMRQWQLKVGGLFCWFALNAGVAASNLPTSDYWSIREKSGVDTRESTALMAFQAGL